MEGKKDTGKLGCVGGKGLGKRTSWNSKYKYRSYSPP